MQGISITRTNRCQQNGRWKEPGISKTEPLYVCIGWRSRYYVYVSTSTFVYVHTTMQMYNLHLHASMILITDGYQRFVETKCKGMNFEHHPRRSFINKSKIGYRETYGESAKPRALAFKLIFCYEVSAGQLIDNSKPRGCVW